MKGTIVTMNNDNEEALHEQLRQAWRQIAELQWQLQSEQQTARRQDRMLAVQDAAMTDVRARHENALADRDREIADLEDEHTDFIEDTHRRHKSTSGHPSRENALDLLRAALATAIHESTSPEFTTEMQEWQRSLDAEMAK